MKRYRGEDVEVPGAAPYKAKKVPGEDWEKAAFLRLSRVLRGLARRRVIVTFLLNTAYGLVPLI